MLKVHPADICIESPKQNEFVNIVVDKAQSDHMLGRGSFGRVYKASYKEQPVAVKIIQKINNHTFTSVSQESNILGWNHKNIIKIIKITSLDDCFTIIMERFPGISLRKLLTVMDLPLFHRIRICCDIINGLRFCHSRNLVHLDVKPQNILVAFGSAKGINSKNNYICKIFDFGCSTYINENNQKKHQGTVRYMSPDVLQGCAVSFKDDIYSFGITMWQLKANEDPYHKISSNDFVAYHVVKSNLRPDSQLKFRKIDETTLSTINISSRKKMATDAKSYSNTNRNPYDILTPNLKRQPLVTKFFSGGHSKKHLILQSFISNKVVKKLDFNSVRPDIGRSPNLHRSVKKNRVVVKQKLSFTNVDDNVFEEDDLMHFFNESHTLSHKKKFKIENEYSNIYKQCWVQNALKRPSSQVVFNLLHLIVNLID